MATLLFRLGRLAARRAKAVIALWCLLLALSVGAAGAFGGEATTEITLPDLQSVEVSERIDAAFPEASMSRGDGVDVLAHTTADEPFSTEQRQSLDQWRQDLELHHNVVEVTDPFAAMQAVEQGRDEVAQARAAGADQTVQGAADLDRADSMLQLAGDAVLVSDDGGTAIFTIRFDGDLNGMATEDIVAVVDTVSSASIEGVVLLPQAELAATEAHGSAVVELLGIAIAGVVLVAMLRSLVGAGLPLLNALVGVGIGLMLTAALSGFVDVLSVTSALGLMLGLAVGIDYALFIVHRHRTQLKAGMSVADSIPLATATAGNAVLFAGTTVIIALLAMNVVGLPFLGLMGTVAALFVAIAVSMAVTMTPALLSVAGARLLSRRERAALESSGAAPHPSGTASSETPVATVPRGTAMNTPRAVAIAVACTVGLGLLATPALDLRLGLPADNAHPEGTIAHRAYDATTDAFGAGWNGPLVAIADLPAGLDDAEGEQHQIDVARELLGHPDVASVVPALRSDDNSVAILQIVPEDGPSMASTEALVHDLRDGDYLADTDLSDVVLTIAGLPTVSIEITDVVAGALPQYLALVIVLSVLLMIVVFRSILLPVIATLGFIGSFTGAVGAVVAVYQWGWLDELFPFGDPGPVLIFMPVIALGVLFGLAMDYQLFTAAGMREAFVRGAAPRLAVRQGLRAGRSVVVAAALIMAAVFAGFAFSSDPMVAPLGLGLAVGVLLDAFVVRLLLVPAVLHLCGSAVWWLPAWARQVLPHVDIEGSGLNRRPLAG